MCDFLYSFFKFYFFRTPDLAAELASRRNEADSLRARLEEGESKLTADREKLEEEKESLVREKLKMNNLQEFASRKVLFSPLPPCLGSYLFMYVCIYLFIVCTGEIKHRRDQLPHVAVDAHARSVHVLR